MQIEDAGHQYGNEFYCFLCERNSWEVDGCILGVYTSYDGTRTTHRVKYGHDPDYARCPDCGVKLEECHHVGCLGEVCAVCGSEIPSCICGWDLYDEGGS